ncbi:MBL fold metallo-hydrolase [Desulfitobacterium sp. THU1]|uniref:MBL fold metallo-hydrolase n=1 Tax=Desulfitobacterium sp. THU1 TaxID=3138072 RepID=UPI00404B9138
MMNRGFDMVREVLPNIYINEIPLPNNPLKSINSYVFLSEKRNLIIDTCFNMEDSKKAFYSGVKELGVDLSNTDLLLSHMHPDHMGLAHELSTLGCKVLLGKKDGEILDLARNASRKTYVEMHRALGLGLDTLTTSNQDFVMNTLEFLDYQLLVEGDEIVIGDYALTVVDTPGHSPGHICLYDKEKKLFISGDHILGDITPNISFWGYEIDSLGAYLDSLKKVHELDIELVLPAHRNLIHDCRQRIEELIAHHQERTEEILVIVGDGRKTASQAAAEMHWDNKFGPWDELPGVQKWFSAGEALSHLEHLVWEGKLIRITNKDSVCYELV